MTALPSGFLELKFLYYGANGEFQGERSCPEVVLRPELLPESEVLGFHQIKRARAVDERLGMKTRGEFRLLENAEGERRYALELCVETQGAEMKHVKVEEYTGYASNKLSVVNEGMKPSLSRVEVFVTFFYAPKLPPFLQAQLEA